MEFLRIDLLADGRPVAAGVTAVAVLGAPGEAVRLEMRFRVDGAARRSAWSVRVYVNSGASPARAIEHVVAPTSAPDDASRWTWTSAGTPEYVVTWLPAVAAATPQYTPAYARASWPARLPPVDTVPCAARQAPTYAVAAVRIGVPPRNANIDDPVVVKTYLTDALFDDAAVEALYGRNASAGRGVAQPAGGAAGWTESRPVPSGRGAAQPVAPPTGDACVGMLRLTGISPDEGALYLAVGGTGDEPNLLANMIVSRWTDAKQLRVCGVAWLVAAHDKELLSFTLSDLERLANPLCVRLEPRVVASETHAPRQTIEAWQRDVAPAAEFLPLPVAGEGSQTGVYLVYIPSAPLLNGQNVEATQLIDKYFVVETATAVEQVEPAVESAAIVTEPPQQINGVAWVVRASDAGVVLPFTLDDFRRI